MKEMLPPASFVYTDQYYQSPTYPVKVLRAIADFYGFSEVDASFLSKVSLTSYEKEEKVIMNQVWFGSMLKLDPSAVRSVIDKFKNARSFITHRPAGAPMVTEPSSVAGPSRASAIHRTQVKAEPTPAPVPHFPQVLDLSPIQQARMARNAGSVQQRDQQEFEDTRKATYIHQHFAGRKLSSSQKADYFVNVLEGPARTFLLNNQDPDMTYEQVLDTMKKEYNSDSRQLQVQSTLEGLKLSSFMASHSLASESDGLTKLVRIH
eukprot:IDg22283t1